MSNNFSVSSPNSYSQALYELSKEDNSLKIIEKELNLRKENNLPPYERFISLILTSNNEKKLEIESQKLKKNLLDNIKAKILGPVNAPIFRIKRKFRNRLLIRSSKNKKIQENLSNVLKNYKFPSGIKLTVDVDPITFN